MMFQLNGGSDYIVYQYRKEEQIEIEDIVVTSERGKGIGSQLVEYIKPKARRIFAFTREENSIARSFYKKLGFKGVLIANFYDDGNAVLFVYENSLRR